jgi:hypothetical protein
MAYLNETAKPSNIIWENNSSSELDTSSPNNLSNVASNAEGSGKVLSKPCHGENICKKSNAEEVVLLRKKLDEANDQIARMNQELHESHISRHTIEHAIGPASDIDINFAYPDEITEQQIQTLQNNLNAATRTYMDGNLSVENQFPAADSSMSALPPHLNAIWGSNLPNSTIGAFPTPPPSQWNQPHHVRGGDWTTIMNVSPSRSQKRHGDTTGLPTNTTTGHFVGDPSHMIMDNGIRRSVTQPDIRSNRPLNVYEGPNPTSLYQPRPAPPRLSPTALEFNDDAINFGPWSSHFVSESELSQFIR